MKGTDPAINRAICSLQRSIYCKIPFTVDLALISRLDLLLLQGSGFPSYFVAAENKSVCSHLRVTKPILP